MLLGVTDNPLVDNVTVCGVVTGIVTVVELLPDAMVNGTESVPAITFPLRPLVNAEQDPAVSTLLQALTVTVEPAQVTPAPVWLSLT